MTSAVDMASGYDVPKLKKVLSARVRLSSHAKIAQVQKLWREKARLDLSTDEEVDAIDVTHVVDTLLAKALDDELAQWGGFARTPEQEQAQVKQLRAAHDAASKKSK